jgi:hypothetical protein
MSDGGEYFRVLPRGGGRLSRDDAWWLLSLGAKSHGAMKTNERAAARAQLGTILGTLGFAPQGSSSGPVTAAFFELCHAEIVHCVDRLQEGKTWDVQVVRTLPIVRFTPRPHGLLIDVGVRIVMAHLLTAALATVGPQLRRCPECKGFFIKRHRMQFCSPACSDQKRQREFRARHRSRPSLAASVTGSDRRRRLRKKPQHLDSAAADLAGQRALEEIGQTLVDGSDMPMTKKVRGVPRYTRNIS